MTQALQAVFVDRDGTIGGNGHYIHPRDFELYPFSLDAIRLLKENGIKVFAFTNQHRIARGEAGEPDFIEQFHSYGFDACYIFPHDEDAGCDCRKPKPGLLVKAAEEHNLELTRCAVIGDMTGWGKGSLEVYRHKWQHVEPDFVASDFWEAAKWLIAKMSVGL